MLVAGKIIKNFLVNEHDEENIISEAPYNDMSSEDEWN
jgi:hypothetical protein